jgi:carboxyl-terminal processing protease
MTYTSDKDAELDVPLTVLINGNSASASELFAGNIQDFKAGLLVGTTSFGKGIMQQIYYTDALRETGVKLTVADYYIHSGKNIHGIGLTPDVEVELDEALWQKAAIEKSEDNQLQEAIRILIEQLGQTAQ